MATKSGLSELRANGNQASLARASLSIFERQILQRVDGFAGDDLVASGDGLLVMSVSSSSANSVCACAASNWRGLASRRR